MQAAFDYGADFVEFDVHPTVDDRFVVFHDWVVECRTEGSGVTREHTLEQLQQLDIGYGYTADEGKTWPFRGKGVGLMPSLEQVMTAFPDRNFFIDVKGNDANAGALLGQRLALLSAGRTGEIVVYGGPRAVAAIQERLPQIRTLTRPRLKGCLKRYIGLGWPDRLLQRMERVGTRVVLIGDYAGEGFSKGFDDPERLTELPADYSGGIWTDRIDLIGPAVRAR